MILPKARRRHAESLKNRRGELDSVLQDRRRESRGAIELMTARVERRQAVEMEHRGLVVLDARYGTRGQSTFNRMTSSPKSDTGSMIDITTPVAALVRQSQLVNAQGVNKVSLSRRISFCGDLLLTTGVSLQSLASMMQLPLKSKVLQVHYLFGGKEHFVEVRDGRPLSCPREFHRA